MLLQSEFVFVFTYSLSLCQVKQRKHEYINWIPNKLLQSTHFIFQPLLFVFMNSFLGVFSYLTHSYYTASCKWLSLLIKTENLKCNFSNKLFPPPPLDVYFLGTLPVEIWSNKHMMHKTHNLSDYLHYLLIRHTHLKLWRSFSMLTTQTTNTAKWSTLAWSLPQGLKDLL